MTEWLLALVPTYGPALLVVAVFLSCFALPVPASMLLLAAGGFVAAGDLQLATVAGASFAGLVAGDHSVYLLGRIGGTRLAERLGRRAAPIAKARTTLAERGGFFLFLSRWLFSPIAPYVNFAAGAVGLRWPRFLAWGTAGEIMWLAIFITLGYVFAGSLEAASQFAFDAIVLIGAAVLTVALGIRLFGQHKRHPLASRPSRSARTLADTAHHASTPGEEPVD